jgi:hypothetical protein
MVVFKQQTFLILKSNTADRVLVVGAGFTELQKDTRQVKSKDVKSKDVLIAQRSVATLCTTLDIVSPLQRLIHDKSGPCHMTQLEDTGEQP